MTVRDTPVRGLIRRVRSAAALAAGLVTMTVVGVVVTTSDEPARGLDTTCGDFVRMSDDDRVGVIRDSGLWVGHPEKGVSYYLAACPQGDADDRLRDFEG